MTSAARTNSTDLLPVGSILAYAGKSPAGVPAGWLVCDGAALTEANNQELFAVIGTAFGKPKEGEFNLPDLRGVFLRGVAGGSSADPDRTTRLPLHEGGNRGDAVGTLQTYATASPKNPFKVTIPNGYVHRGKFNPGCDSSVASWVESKQEDVVDVGGDAETRPRNKYVYWIIKATLRVGKAYVVPPCAAVLAMAGLPKNESVPRHWYPCDGKGLDIVAIYKSLFEAIEFVHGRQGGNVMVLPDYRGWFLRGVEGTESGLAKPRDPNANERGYAYPEGAVDCKGNHGNAVGSSQGSATALPNTPFRTVIRNMPQNKSGDKILNGNDGDRKLVKNFGGSYAFQGRVTGGDPETRPVNLAVYWYLCWAAIGTKDPVDQVPIGAVVAYGGTVAKDAPEIPGYRRCDGALLAIEEFPQLYLVIGNDYGGEVANGTFALPNYAGRFLRGAEGARHPSQSTEQAFSTGKPTANIGFSIRDFPNSLQNAKHIAGSDQSGKTQVSGDLEVDACTLGGDAESRPINVAVEFLIKVKG